ncbi:MAG: hypothetical protein HXX10_27065 [Rhodoplanes sp.]|uniref:hypothetical protein n=1 Tax=Rhodoplanes sp. TaxID=1968906 RepID=UPI0017CAFD75|nr:hypothetical protein [Rhodoplanes sp.]NVO17702.1 hypothetical protein [Rhodoplanes sp.]
MLLHLRPMLVVLVFAGLLGLAGLFHAHPVAGKAPDPHPAAVSGPAGDAMRIVPADAARDLTGWHPLTGDGSN